MLLASRCTVSVSHIPTVADFGKPRPADCSVVRRDCAFPSQTATREDLGLINLLGVTSIHYPQAATD